MDFVASKALAPVTYLEEVTSTFDAVDESAPDFATWVTLNQTGGRGRLGRVWQTPPNRALAACVLVRPTVPKEHWGWLPLATGLALASALDPLLADTAEIKWPNDLLVGGKKIAGILAEVRADAVVLGFGVNLTFAQEELPVETATSATLEGAEGSVEALSDAVLSRVLHELQGFLPALGTDRLRTAVANECHTLGRSVRAMLPDGSAIEGTAVALGDHGELIIEAGSARHSVAAGDIVHLR